MKTIAAGEFKARCLRIMEDVRTKRTPVLITKRGKPLAKLAPPDDKPPDILGDVWPGRWRFSETWFRR
jgi:prevent-host-death family protein